MLPHVVRWNAGHVGDRYRDLLDVIGRPRESASKLEPPVAAAEQLAARLDALAHAGGLARTLRELGIPRDSLPALAADAATQWTGTINPRPFDEAAALTLYERAY
jgi:alcohol dehydrogenase class IV